ncbi:histidine phosphatase superfamily (branch 1) domain-containing protein [Hirsutella rhossiliensis]|uniref:Histidine phosphatase superfamily (Branch 1) domain-containing protein n=1 Tax=Hirsutella rhossiliensis TaxID=111463 RepID=A0A9P8SNS3_9HYPO|nr:histidine phosphatase superfamily (branch 1) domain-containing protein [Hirsutella rhossiliensis]KAH0967446.1 histidine phosphatase superfamily (branch 1) domain-containing protein [Hirsutella rhossiliensis]
MSPQIVLIRHAEALHNNYSIPDPPLTDLGIEQCAALRANLKERFESAPGSVAVIVSPMLRTLQTATLALDWLIRRGVVFEASADWQENSTKPCDTGSPAASVSPSFPHVDFSRLDPVWPDKTSPDSRRYAHSRAAILARGADALDALHHRPEDLIFVVSHSGFLRSGVVGWWFFNADYRIFRFGEATSAADEASKGAGDPQQAMTTRQVLCQDETTLAGGLGLSHAFPVELGSELPGEDEVPEEDLVI